MTVTQKALDVLSEINKRLDFTHELQTEIHTEVFFRRNSVNLLIGKKGSGKTYNVFREVLKLKFIPKHDYTKFIYVTNKAYDPVFERILPCLLEIMPVKKIPYSEAVEEIHTIAKAKNALHKIIEDNIDLNDLEEDSKELLAETIGVSKESLSTTDANKHTIILLDDCQDVFDKRTATNKELFKLLFENRQPKITYFLTQQDPKGIDTSLKQNMETAWLFGGFTQRKFNYLLRDIPHEEESAVLWDIYKHLSKHQPMIFNIKDTGTELIVLKK